MEQALAQVDAFLRGLLDAVQGVGHLVGGGAKVVVGVVELVARMRVADHHAEDVVEVVRDATGQAPEPPPFFCEWISCDWARSRSPISRHRSRRRSSIRTGLRAAR
jgi:hypothetical protein